MITASETRAGVRSGSRKERALPTKEDPDPKKKRMKKRESRCLWACENFKKMSVGDRWNIAKEHKLRFRCLTDGHRGEASFRSRICGIKGGHSHHHRVLDKGSKKDEQAEVANEADSSIVVKGSASIEGKPSERTYTANTGAEPVSMAGFTALENVSVYKKNGKEGLK